ncbi:MAG: HD domain-containing phosphohydrolase [Thermodesulfovibrionales bacterium]|nr:HD domain-containing phosphohydrolase [Thermodesulfovibrionales bacterium]
MVLRTKIITAIALVLLVSISISTAIVLNVQGKRMITAEIKNMELLSRVILSSIEDAMSKGKSSEVQQILKNIGTSKELITLRIVSADGYILKSKIPDEIGKKSREYSQFKDAEAAYLSSVRDNAVTHFSPIRNREACHGCHSPGIKVTGIIEITYDVSRSQADMAGIKKFLIFSNIITVFVVALLLSALITKLIIKPLSGFMSAIREVENGNWEAKIHTSDDDELGTIGTAFNSMVQEIKRLYDKNLRKEKEVSKAKVELEHKRKLEELNSHLEYKIKEVETANKAVLSLSKEVKFKNIELEKMVERLKRINDVGKVLTSVIETAELIKLIIKTTAEMLYAERGSIHLKKNEESRLTLQYKRGLGIEDTTDISLDFHPLYKELLNEGRNIFISKNNILQKMSDITTPAIGVPLKMRGQIVGGMLLEEKVDGAHFTAEELELLGTMGNQAMVAIENAWLYETVKTNYFGTIQSLVNALEANDRYTKGHSERVKLLSVELAKYVGLDYKELEVLEHAAILHDIGKIGIDSVVLNKAGRLSIDEFSLIKAHPIIGDEILGPIGTLESVRQTILQHHERYDGTGYPYGIAGEEICLKARILTVVDTFDAMLTDRPYRKALSIDKVREELRVSAGNQFDPYVVNTFLEMIDTKNDFLLSLGYSLS